ncbi:putative superoxide dismutase, partial [Trachipleistophora hominis]
MYELPELPYEYDALEPQIDENTMIIHHTKHHQKYIDNLNNALKDTKYPETTVGLLLNLIKKTDDLNDDLRNVLYFNAGSHYNHTMYWHCMSSEPAHKEMMKPL